MTVMNSFRSITQTTLTASTTDLAHANSAGFDFTSRAHAHEFNVSLNVHSHSSHRTADDLVIAFASSQGNKLAASASKQAELNCFNQNQSGWVSQDGTMPEIATLAQPTRQWLDFASASSTIAQTSFAQTDSAQATQPTIELVVGTLGADTFTVLPVFQYHVFSGNGNVDFGKGGRDVIDLSSVLSSSVTFNLATATRGGVIFNPGNGAQVFDAISFGNGNQILFEGIDQVRFADGILNLSITPNDPGFSQQWNLHMMGVQSAWRFTTGSTKVLVGIEDTGLGIDVTGNIHPDLRSSNTIFYNGNTRDDFFRNVSGQEYGPKATSHGTDVQGIIAAASNNGIGMSGINWHSTVANLDVLDNNPGDLTQTQATQVLINQANNQGQRLVINMSLGVPDSAGRTDLDPAFEQVVASNPNTLFVIASGNENIYGISYPSSLAQKYNNVIAVGASWGTQDTNGVPKAPGTRISYPGWWGSNYGNGLTVMGPSEVIATSATTTSTGVQFGYDLKFNGTSAATPNVTGVASLVWSANPNLSAGQVKGILSQTAYDLGAKGYDQVYGNGFVNADTAVRRAMAIGAGAA